MKIKSKWENYVNMQANEKNMAGYFGEEVL